MAYYNNVLYYSDQSYGGQRYISSYDISTLTSTLLLIPTMRGILLSDNLGNLYIGCWDPELGATRFNNQLIKYNISSNAITQIIAGSGITSTIYGFGTSASFTRIMNMTFDSSSNIYFIDNGSYIRRIDATTNYVFTVAGKGTAGYSDGVGTNAMFDFTTNFQSHGLAIDLSGNIYVSDLTVNNKLRKITMNSGNDWAYLIRIPQTPLKNNFISFTNSSGTVIHNWGSGDTFYHTSISGNFTANIINLPTTQSTTYTIKLILVQGSSAYYSIGVQIAGVSKTIKWKSATIPTPLANAVEVETFNLYYYNSTWTVLGDYTSYS
jgi:hypothetical protein